MAQPKALLNTDPLSAILRGTLAVVALSRDYLAEHRGLYEGPAACVLLQPLSLGRLASNQEGFRVLTLTADLERAEVLVPGPIGSFGLRLAPQLELVEIFGRYLPFTEAVEKVIPQRRRTAFPPDLRHKK